MNTNPEQNKKLEMATEINTDLNDDDLAAVAGGNQEPNIIDPGIEAFDHTHLGQWMGGGS